MENMTTYYETKNALQRAVINGHDHTSANAAHYHARRALTERQAAKVIYDALASVGIERIKLSQEIKVTIELLMEDLCDIAHN